VPINSGLANTTVTFIVIDPLTPSTLYAGTDGGGVQKMVTAPATVICEGAGANVSAGGGGGGSPGLWLLLLIPLLIRRSAQ
jgi:hypothetical protein